MTEKLQAFWQSHAELIMDVGYKALLAIVVVLATMVLSGWARRSVSKAHQRLHRLDATLVPLLSSLAAYAIYLVGVVIVLDILGFNTSSLIALLGAAGLAVGLALKDTLSNIAAGIMLLILRPFKLADFIECASFSGTVREVGLFTTVLETPDGLYISAPNSSLWGSPIKNFSRNGKRRMDLIVGISYGDSLEAGLTVLTELAQSEERVMKDPAFQVMVQSMGDSSVNLQLRLWSSVDNYWPLYWDMNRRIKEQIEAAGLTIPFPQRVLTMAPGSALTNKDVD
ncbi:mechanosensitive ion channel family protein [Gallaecimonas pentaromativorans]|uniref:mechanosensitive ion channel family protein n=1 Tax=Gallaecimonas pentaromativorans TaxID=584787 RepID=UPI0018DB3DC6|nr:mechanosensitive ion channel family protein [Gallaecimonas pentaromativorans]MED5526510.1 mechanosensitive ion channel family protein [Pseudomonadota bacterium]